MKHPSYSKATNQYSNRANSRLSKQSKQALADELKRFQERLKTLDKD